MLFVNCKGKAAHLQRCLIKYKSNLFYILQGLFAVTFSTLLLTTSAAPIFLPDPITAAVFTAAGGLVLTAASGSALTIPTSTILLGKVLGLKGILLGVLAAQQEG